MVCDRYLPFFIIAQSFAKSKSNRPAPWIYARRCLVFFISVSGLMAKGVGMPRRVSSLYRRARSSRVLISFRIARLLRAGVMPCFALRSASLTMA